MSLHNALYSCDKPILGALEGFAIAGGSALAFTCDFLIVGKNSFLHVAEVERGMQAPINLAWLTIRHSLSLGLKMAVAGERHYGEELVQLGVADRCVDDAEVLTTTRMLAARFAGFDPESTQALKRSLRRAHQNEDFVELVARVKASSR